MSLRSIATMMGAVAFSSLTVGCGGAATPDDLTAAVSSVQEPIINGSTDFTGLQRQKDRTVGILHGAIDCSGTVLRNDVILTARHCVTTDHSMAGPIDNNPANILVSTLGASSFGNRAREIVAAPPNIDSALVFLEQGLAIGFDTHDVATAIDPNPPESYLGPSLLISGFGRDDNGQANILRNGNMWMASPFVSVPFGGTQTFDIQIANQVTGTSGNLGDSGGPLWGSLTMPESVLGVLSSCDGSITNPGECGAFNNNYAARAIDMRQTFREAIASRRNPSRTIEFDSAADVSLFDQVAGNPNTQANWTVSGGAVRQVASVSDVMLVEQDSTFENVEVLTRIGGPNNGVSGILLHYVDVKNHYRCVASDQGNYLRIVARKNGTDSILASTTWTGAWHPLNVTLRAGVQEQQITCQIGGLIVQATDGFLPIGRVGLYNSNNQNAAYYYLQTSQFAPVQNLAVNRPAFQYPEPDPPWAPAGAAVDNNTDGDWAHGSVTHTDIAFSPWWWVDLGSVQHVKQINLFNRTDCCASRLSHYQIFTSTDSTDGWNGTWPLVVDASGTVIADGDTSSRSHSVDAWARWVAVRVADTNYLSLAEVQVFGW